MGRMSDAYYYVDCEICGDEIGIVINITATPDLNDRGAIRLSVGKVDYQPIWDHQFENHVELPVVE